MIIKEKMKMNTTNIGNPIIACKSIIDFVLKHDLARPFFKCR
jgi:hypothetical protein